ncbi:shikimate kinase [Nonlabens antarcticus]|uniref:shikimate kinase n=1 Tax=Nonlabens antarcticus TaxID=392714 RepID=UPI001891B32E|nr:shikimate kinase [Nonlabens antarcticus]
MSEESKSVIVLLGYMGSGKTTVGQELASVLSYVHIDLDDYIESSENSTIAEIIDQKGIIYFRKQEMTHLEMLLKRSEKTVLSLGGGTPCYYDNMNLVNKCSNAASIYLRANVPFLTDRLFIEKEHRPLIRSIDDKEELAEFIGKHLLERSIFYDMADFTVSIEGKTPQQLAQEIRTLV